MNMSIICNRIGVQCGRIEFERIPVAGEYVQLTKDIKKQVKSIEWTTTGEAKIYLDIYTDDTNYIKKMMRINGA